MRPLPLSLVVSHLVPLLFLFLSLVSVVSLLDSFDGFASLSDCISFHFEISGFGKQGLVKSVKLLINVFGDGVNTAVYTSLNVLQSLI